MLERVSLYVWLLAMLVISGGVALAQSADLRKVFSAPIGIERGSPAASIPLELKAGKLFLDASANGKEQRFIFDTGSPTILARGLAEELGLAIVGQNTGTDANGERVTMDVAVLETLTLGDVTFRNVPVMIFDFASLDMGGCLIEGGVIGSEIFPGSAWRIDLQNQRLGIAASAKELGGGKPTHSAPLHDFGYPHAPIIDYRLADITDKALFDTGSAEQVTLFEKLTDNPTVRKVFVPGSASRGRGHEGESAGGRGAVRDIERFTLTKFGFSEGALEPVRATTRAAPPTLVGAGVLATHIITMDYPAGQLRFDARQSPGPIRRPGGFAIAMAGDGASVVQLFDGSPAAKAGLRLGDTVIAAQGRSLAVTHDTPKCETALWLAETFDPAAGGELVVLRDGRSQTLVIPAMP